MINTHRNNILEFFATYRVEAPDGLIDALAFYAEQQEMEERDRIFKMFTDQIDHIREKRHERS